MIDQREEIAFAGAADHVADIQKPSWQSSKTCSIFDAGFLIPVLFALRFSACSITHCWLISLAIDVVRMG